MTSFADFLAPATVQNARDQLAGFAQFVMYAEDMYVSTAIDPPLDPRFAPEWKFIDWLRTTVAANIIGDIEHWLLRRNETTYFGALFQSNANPDSYLVVLRGTESGPEWAQNAVFTPDLLHAFKSKIAAALTAKSGSPKLHRSGGAVPSGFHGIYEELTFGGVAVANPPIASKGIVDAITALQTGRGSTIGQATLTISSHSLGSAVASYLAYDLAQPPVFGSINAYLFATPMPGDGIYARSLAATVLNCVSVVYERDLVPQVPPGYAPLTETITIKIFGTASIGKEITADAQVDDSPGCNHHVICYAAMLSPAVAAAVPCNASDSGCVSCIVTPAAIPAIGAGGAAGRTLI